MSSQQVSRERVANFGEVYTGKREVNDMLDLVKNETERIESRFLEPACGTGNFLVEVLERKLRIVQARYGKSQLEYERYSFLAVASLYGIDIQECNVEDCRKRLFGVFDWSYSELYGDKARNECRRAVKFVLSRNMIHGDALKLETVDARPGPIIFSEWSLVRGSLVKRRDYAFKELLPEETGEDELDLFANPRLPNRSDTGERKIFIPEPIKVYPLTHFLRLADVESE